MTTSNTPIYASQARPWLKFYDQKYIDQTMPACTAFELVCRQNKNRLGETALEYYGRKFTYADFIVNVKKTAAALRAAGLKKGDIATVVSVMTPEIIFAFYAADMIGATLNLVDPRYSVEGIREYIEEVDSHLLICLNVVYERCHQAAKRTHVEHVVVLSPADSLPLPLALGYKVKNLDKNKYHSNVIHWKQFLAAGKDESIAAEPYDPEHACVVVHTGGTTGSPKGVMLTDNNFNGIAMQFSACDTLFSKGQSLLNIMPPFIAYGFACGVHLPLTLGIKVVIIPNLDSNKLGSLIWKYKPEHMFGVPSHYQQLAVDPKLQNKDLSFIRNYAAGGDAIARGAEQTVNDFLAAHNVEFPIAKGYGMTEASSAATAAAGRNNKPGSVGLPLVNTAIRAVLETRGLTDGKAFQYMAYYRTALGALPNLLAALALFYLFKGLDLGCVRWVNALAGTTLGVYILHQVPAFRGFLWNGLLQAEAHHGSVGYTLLAILAVFLGCAAVDALRTALVMRPLENTRLFKALCEKGDALAAKITADD